MKSSFDVESHTRYNSLNVLLIGDSQTGKSHFSTIYSRRGFYKFLQSKNPSDIYEIKKMTIGKMKGMQIRISKRSKGYILKLYDLCGEKNSEKYLDLYLSMKDDIDIIIFCFDITNLRTLENIKKWIKILSQKSKPDNPQQVTISVNSNGSSNEQIKKYLHYNGFQQDHLCRIPILLLGCKIDQVPDIEQLRIKIAKQVQSFFENFDGRNIFLISNTRLEESHYQFVKLEEELDSFINDQNGRTRYLLTSSIVNNQINFDQFWIKNVQFKWSKLKLFLQSCFRRLMCKKIKK